MAIFSGPLFPHWPQGIWWNLFTSAHTCTSTETRINPLKMVYRRIPIICNTMENVLAPKRYSFSSIVSLHNYWQVLLLLFHFVRISKLSMRPLSAVSCPSASCPTSAPSTDNWMKMRNAVEYVTINDGHIQTVVCHRISNLKCVGLKFAQEYAWTWRWQWSDCVLFRCSRSTFEVATKYETLRCWPKRGVGVGPLIF